jgi:uncharacterized protein YqhQ
LSAGTNGDRASTNGSGTLDADTPSAAAEQPLRLGGMALRNGLLIHGPTSWAIAARESDGSIVVASGEKPRAPARLVAIPLLRGPLRLAEGFAFIPLARRRAPAARLPLEDGRVAIAAIAATLVAAGLRRSRLPVAFRETAASLLGLLPALVALRDHDLAAYHGAEHKQIGGYETGRDPAEVPKEHGRCGSHLVAPILVLSVGGQLMLERRLERPGRLARGITGLATLSLAVELFVWSERHPDSPLARVLRAPGMTLQRTLATREPSVEQMEVGSTALDAVLHAEGRT